MENSPHDESVTKTKITFSWLNKSDGISSDKLSVNFSKLISIKLLDWSLLSFDSGMRSFRFLNRLVLSSSKKSSSFKCMLIHCLSFSIDLKYAISFVKFATFSHSDFSRQLSIRVQIFGSKNLFLIYFSIYVVAYELFYNWSKRFFKKPTFSRFSSIHLNNFLMPFLTFASKCSKYIWCFKIKIITFSLLKNTLIPTFLTDYRGYIAAW